MNTCSKCLTKNAPSAAWCENCGEMLIPDTDHKADVHPRPYFREYWYEPSSGKAKFIRFVAMLALFGGLYWCYTVACDVLSAMNGVNYDGMVDQILSMLPGISVICACVFGVIAVYVALRSFAEMVQNSTVTRSMNEFMMRKLERMESRR